MSLVETKHHETTTHGLPVGYDADNGSLAVSLARAEVDQQISTAHAFPRSITRAVQNITALATLDEQSAEECIYALPRGGKPIKGPSIRLAEIISSQWGNCRVGARVVHIDRFEKYIEAEGVFHDLESNTATTARVRRRISDKHGRLLSDDMIIVTGNAACSIAKRNAILGGVPKAVWRKAYESVENVLTGDVKTLVERRERALKAFAAFGVKPEQIFVALEVNGIDDIGIEHLSTLVAMRSALKNNEATVEEMFPTPKPQQKTPATLAGKLDALATKKETPAHDPETGEVAQEAAAEPVESEKQDVAAEVAETQESAPAADFYADGRAAAERGMSRKALPPALREESRRDDAKAWLRGFDDFSSAA